MSAKTILRANLSSSSGITPGKGEGALDGPFFFGCFIGDCLESDLFRLWLGGGSIVSSGCGSGGGGGSTFTTLLHHAFVHSYCSIHLYIVIFHIYTCTCTCVIFVSVQQYVRVIRRGSNEHEVVLVHQFHSLERKGVYLKESRLSNGRTVGTEAKCLQNLNTQTVH